MPVGKKQSSEAAVRGIRRWARRRISAEEKIRIVLEGLRGKDSIAVLRESRARGGRGGDDAEEAFSKEV